VSTHKRKYQLKARAQRQQQTRERIVAATVALHEEVGPARTTIADIARRAGVQRLTVYNTFPEVRDLFVACQGLFLAHHPPPDLAAGASSEDALKRLETALAELYGWYRANEAMERKVHRDRHLLPVLDTLMRETGDARLDAAAAAYGEAIGDSPRAVQSVRPLIRLALEFRTWEMLADHGMPDADVARLFGCAVRAAAGC
jgi:AcrR family transcriptional regulator